MELRSFIKLFTWQESDRDRVTLGPNTRLNPATHRAQLGTYGEDTYPTDADLYVKSWVTFPKAVKQWQGFEATILHKKVEGVQVTSDGFRLADGTDERWWNGSSWEVNTTDWNTEAEVAANIQEFPTAARKIQVVVNLATADSTLTPELVEVKVLFGALLDSEVEDMVLRSFVPALRSYARAVTRVPLTKAGTDDEIDLNDYKMDGDYRIVGVDGAFNDTDDPEHDTDLYDSHTLRSTPEKPWTDGTVDVITLSASVDDGKQVWLRLLYEPIVAVETSRDWYELEHLPSLIVESVSFRGRKLAGEDHVGNKGDGTAKVIPAPLQGRLELGLRGVAGILVDHNRLADKVTRFFGDNPTLASTGLDESYRLWLVDEHEHRGGPNSENIHTWRKTVRIENFRVWDQGVRDGYLVKQFKFTGSLDVTVE